MKAHRSAFLVVGLLGCSICSAANQSASGDRRLLYVAVPGVRNDLQYGGHGILVFDIDNGHRFVRRIPIGGVDEHNRPLNVKGICANAGTRRLYVSTLRTLMSLDLVSEKLLWERPYDGGCDRMAMSPDGRTIYLPSLEGDYWHVVDAETGSVIAKVVTRSHSHNTIYGLDGKHVYLAGLGSPFLTVAQTSTHTVSGKVGPFSTGIRPFTVNGRQTPDEKEIWVTDGHNHRLHVFDARRLPPKMTASIALRDEPDWVTFSIDGQYAYPSTGDVIETRPRKIVARLADEHGAAVESEKLVEIDWQGTAPSRAGDQFGVGRVR